MVWVLAVIMGVDMYMRVKGALVRGKQGMDVKTGRKEE